jgi:signal transduction histidine kinase
LDELGDLASAFNQHMTGAIQRDIRERKESEAALAKAKVAADTANRAKSDFLADMIHEVSTL